MNLFTPGKKFAYIALAFLFCFSIFQGCKKKRSEMGKVFFKHTHNPVYKDLDGDDFTVVFKKVLAGNKNNVSNPDFITNYYDQNDYEPVFLMNHLWNGDLNTMLAYFKKADEHGLSPGLFQPDKIKALIDKLLDKNAEKTPEEAYEDMAKLEVLSANSMINYSSDLQFGVISPKKIYARYFIKTPRPDSTSMGRVFRLDNMKAYLDSIQPKSPEYLALQKAYLDRTEGPKMSKEETRRILLVNLERLRWKNKPAENRYVYVNIPDFHLDVIDSGKAVLSMKVCVGEGRNKKYLNSLENYNDT
ncbi:MAG TPA: L,D-transpeptidase, partial [Mucilaginibacter sp.]|nr:L,D-transpeptidase [Mucilaginibacter sp.]